MEVRYIVKYVLFSLQEDSVSISVISPIVVSADPSNTGYYDIESEAECSHVDDISFDVVTIDTDHDPDTYIVAPEYRSIQIPKRKKKKSITQKAKKCIGISIMVIVMFGFVVGILSSKLKGMYNYSEHCAMPTVEHK
jgi:hypothetical protein